jgi:hypothetical protein
VSSPSKNNGLPIVVPMTSPEITIFHSPVLLAAGRGAIIGHRHQFAKPGGGQIGIRQSLIDWILRNRIRSLLREFLVELSASRAIGISL